MILERRITAADRFQFVEEVQHHFCHRQFIGDLNLSTHVIHADLRTALLFAQRDAVADIVRWGEDVRADDRLADFLDVVGRRQLGRIVQRHHRTVGLQHFVDHGGRGADQIEVTFNDRRKMPAVIVGTDPNTDIALIKVEAQELPFLVFGNSDHVKVGEWVLAVGNPFNLNSTVTAGIVSAKARDINILGKRSSVDSFIQTDAVVNRGNSGGALVNTAGELIGINAAIASHTGVYEGYSFAIPSNIVKKITDDIIRFGEPQRAFLGVEIREMDQELAKQVGENEIKGVYIANVLPQGGAAQAGLETGDVILELNQRPVNTLSQLLETVGQHRPGDEVEVLVLRNQKPKTYKVVLRNQDGNTKVLKTEDAFFNKDLGVKLAKLSNKERQKYGISNGLKVVEVQEGIMQRGGISNGFIILSINNQKIDNKDDISRAINNTRSRFIKVQGMYPNGMKISFEFLN